MTKLNQFNSEPGRQARTLMQRVICLENALEVLLSEGLEAAQAKYKGEPSLQERQMNLQQAE